MIKDRDDRVIEVGDRVMQVGVNPSAGALVQHEYAEGIVVSLGRTRVGVRFTGSLVRQVHGDLLGITQKAAKPDLMKAGKPVKTAEEKLAAIEELFSKNYEFDDPHTGDADLIGKLLEILYGEEAGK